MSAYALHRPSSFIYSIRRWNTHTLFKEIQEEHHSCISLSHLFPDRSCYILLSRNRQNDIRKCVNTADHCLSSVKAFDSLHHSVLYIRNKKKEGKIILVEYITGIKVA